MVSRCEAVRDRPHSGKRLARMLVTLRLHVGPARCADRAPSTLVNTRGHYCSCIPVLWTLRSSSGSTRRWTASRICANRRVKRSRSARPSALRAARLVFSRAKVAARTSGRFQRARALRRTQSRHCRCPWLLYRCLQPQRGHALSTVTIMM